MTFNQFLRIIKARWALVLTIASTVVIGALVVSLLLPKAYTSTATVMADVRPDPVSAITNASAYAGTYLATQVDIIKSANVAQRVVRDLRLADNDTMRARWTKATDGKGDLTAWVAETIARGLDVRPSRESNVIEINYEGADPAFSSTLANAFAKAYIDSTVQIKVDPARQYAEFFEDRARMAREKLELARAKLTEAQRDKGIIVTEERLDVENARLNELSTQVSGLRALKAETSSRNTQTNSSPDQSTDVLSNVVIANLKADLARSEAHLKELTSRYGDAYPVVIETRASIADMRDKIRAETIRVTGSVRMTNTVATSREADAVAAFNAQRERVLKLKGARAELQVLEREVDSAQRVYDSIQDRLSQTSLESSTSQSGIYMLSAATEPTHSTSPRVLLNTVVALVLGTLLALMIALSVELYDRRVRGPIDILQALDMPVIGTLPRPKIKSGSRSALGLGKWSTPSSTTAIATRGTDAFDAV